LDRERFARLSFERDKGCELYPKSQKFETLPGDEKQGYLDEADYYLSRPVAEWPDDIIVRLS